MTTIQNTPDTGGIMAPIMVDMGDFKNGQCAYILLTSDVHIGASNVDYELIQSELQRAAETKARVAINGDIFDAILPGDRKRYDPRTLHHRLRGRTDIMNEAIEMAFEIYAPYVHLIDMVGVGNHDTAVEKHHSFDPVHALVYRLNQIAPKGHRVNYGGYMGSISYKFKAANHRSRFHYDIWYYHGSGGGSVVTHGMIDFHRKGNWLEGFDCIWMGHKHKKPFFVDHTMRLSKNREKYIFRERRHVMTGGYFDTYKQQSQESQSKSGRKTNYAADWGAAPQAKGGVLMEIKFIKTANDWGLDAKTII